jgi:signal transduction histidine kinase
VSRAALAVLACVGTALGVVAEWQAYEWSDVRDWLPDLAAGWTLLALGILLLARRSTGPAVLLLVAGFTWFAFNFADVSAVAITWLAAHAAFLHRGPLFHLALTVPDGRPRTRLVTAGVALAWTAAVAWPLWDDDRTALALAATFVVIAFISRARARGRSSRAIAGRGLVAAAVLSSVIGADAIRSGVGASQGVADVTMLGYDLAVVLVGVTLFTAARLAAPTSLAERAIALEAGGERLRDVLRDLLGDPELEIGFAPDSEELVDDRGRPFAAAATARVASPVVVGGQRVAVIVHDPGALDDTRTRAAVVAVVGLAAERVRLSAAVDRQLDAVDASRRRLLLAEEEERRLLAERLERGAGAELAHVDRLVREARREPGGEPELSAALERAAAQLDRVRPELDALVHGLGGVEPRGLIPGLERLATGLPLEVNLELEDVAVAAEVSAALWFVCSESLANTVKHADARSVRVRLAERDGTVCLVVEDDGCGGANPEGSGLLGLADRVSALGGRVLVSSPPGEGTRVVAELPLADERPVGRPGDIPGPGREASETRAVGIDDEAGDAAVVEKADERDPRPSW